MLNKLKTSVSDLSGRAADLKNVGAEALQGTVAEFNAVRPLFVQVGYRVQKVDVEIGLTPKLTFALRRVATVDDSAFEALLAAHQGNKVLATIVGALRQASLLQARVHFQGLHFMEVQVDLGIPPAIRLTFEEDDTSVGLPTDATIEEPLDLPAEVAAAATPPSPTPPPPVLELPASLPLETFAPLPPPVAVAPEAPSGHQRDRNADLAELIAAGLAVQFECKGCGKKLVVRSRYAGREGECRRCGTVHVIPAPKSLR
jgi:hypothetical protein